MAMRAMPYVPIFRSTPASNTDPTVGAAVCASGSQVCRGHIGVLTASPSPIRSTAPSWTGAGKTRSAQRGERHHVRGSGHAPHPEKSRQHDHRAQHRVKDEDVCSSSALALPPEGDEEPHRDEHYFEEDKEQQQVERDECPEHAHLEQQQQPSKRPWPTWLGAGAARCRPRQETPTATSERPGEAIRHRHQAGSRCRARHPSLVDNKLHLVAACGVEPCKQG